MQWPRGKWNGCRIVGFKFEIRLNILHWNFCRTSLFDHSYLIGPFQIRFAAEYELADLRCTTK